jgi:hypothetical protein
MLFRSSTNEATDRFMRDTILCCNRAERFFLLHNTVYHCRPMGSGNTICRVLWPWTLVLNHDRRSASRSRFILRKKVLNPLIQSPRRGQEEVENW